MELLDVTLTTIQRRNRAAFVQRSGRTPMSPGEKVVLRDEGGEYFAGSVVDWDEAETGDGRRYLVHVGVRLPEDYAMRRLGRVPTARTAIENDVDALLDLLGAARDSLVGRVPAQRAGC
jgi:hypothetical protein